MILLKPSRRELHSAWREYHSASDAYSVVQIFQQNHQRPFKKQKENDSTWMFGQIFHSSNRSTISSWQATIRNASWMFNPWIRSEESGERRMKKLLMRSPWRRGGSRTAPGPPKTPPVPPPARPRRPQGSPRASKTAQGASKTPPRALQKRLARPQAASKSSPEEPSKPPAVALQPLASGLQVASAGCAKR